MKQFLGAILLGCGILIAGVSGLCTLMVVGTSLMDPTSGEMLSMIPAVLIFAGVPFVIGLAMFLGGRHVIRSVDKDAVEANGGSDADVFK